MFHTLHQQPNFLVKGFTSLDGYVFSLGVVNPALTVMFYDTQSKQTISTQQTTTAPVSPRYILTLAWPDPLPTTSYSCAGKRPSEGGGEGKGLVSTSCVAAPKMGW